MYLTQGRKTAVFGHPVKTLFFYDFSVNFVLFRVNRQKNPRVSIRMSKSV